MLRILALDTLRGRIRLLSTLLVLVPLLFATVSLLVYVRTSLAEAKLSDVAEQTEVSRVFLEDWLAMRRSAVRFMAELGAVRTMDTASVNDIFTRYDRTHPDVSAVVLVDEHGRSVVDTSSDIVVDVSDRTYFLEGRAGRPHTSTVLVGRTSGLPIIIFSHPVHDARGRFSGVVFMPVRLTTLNGLLASLQGTGRGQTYLLNQDGYMLTEPADLEPLKAQGRIADTAIMQLKVETAIHEAAMRGAAVEQTYRDYSGREVLGASAWTKGGDWLIVSEADYAEVMHTFRVYLLLVVGGALATLGLFTPVLLRVVRSVEEPIERMHEYATRMQGGIFEMSCSGTGLLDPPREIQDLLDAFCAMQFKVEETVQELDRSSVTDQLTGLPNRRFLMREGVRIMEVAARAGQPCAVFVLDIDHFKSVNDTYGHHAGDEVLVQVSAILDETVRKSDIAARFGGEEFVVVAPNAGADQAVLLAERIRMRIEANPFETGEAVLRCTASIGVTTHQPDGPQGEAGFEQLLRTADAALYEAKQAGRNRVASR